MAGQGTLSIGNTRWAVGLAVTPWELAQGLGGLAALPPGNGMLFDMGAEQTIQVTTVPMLFPLDIAFLSEDLAVTEVYRNIEPGYLVTSQFPARYFLEVNAGELAGVEAGNMAEVTVLSAENPAPDWVSATIGFMTFLMTAIFTTSLVRGFVKSANKESEEKPLVYGPGGETLLAHTSMKAGLRPAVTARDEKPTGTCYADAWRFVIKEGEGKLVHGTVYSGNRRIKHAWVKTVPGFTWEPQTRGFFTDLAFKYQLAPVEESKYTPEEAAIMTARTGNSGSWTGEERSRWLNRESSPGSLRGSREIKRDGNLDLLPDSPEYLAYTIDDIGFREIIDSAFKHAISRAKGI